MARLFKGRICSLEQNADLGDRLDAKESRIEFALHAFANKKIRLHFLEIVVAVEGIVLMGRA